MSAPRIAIFRALQLGDMLCAIPAVRSLRRSLPRAHITLISMPWAEELVERFPQYFDSFMPFPGFPGLPEQDFSRASYPAFLADVRSREFDLVVQMHGSGDITNPVVLQFGGAYTAGFYAPPGSAPSPWFIPYPSTGSEARRLLRLARFLGGSIDDESLEWPVTADDRAELHDLAPELERGRYVCVHPGARFNSRRWGVADFARTADSFTEMEFEVVITGSAGEAELARELADAMNCPALNLAGKTSLGSLGALIDEAALLVCNDTGVSHIAAAVRTPSVVIACGTDVERWAPLNQQRHRVLAADVACRPCLYEDCPYPGHPCARGVLSSTVMVEAKDLVTAEVSVLARGLRT